ncbi:hypothetical protein ACVIJW_005656 [Bradyrhizobium barranii subsp. barranii]
MMVLAMDVGSDGAADRDEARTRHDEGQETARTKGVDQVRQQHAGFEADASGHGIERPDPIEPRHRDASDGADRGIAIGAAVAPSHGARHHGFAHGLERPRPQQLAIDDRETPPAADEGHGSAPVPGVRRPALETAYRSKAYIALRRVSEFSRG